MTPKFDYSRIVFAVVWIIGGFLLLNTLGYWVTAAFKISPPDGIETLIGAALGYCGGILTSTKSAGDPQSVEVVNPRSEPVPIVEENPRD